MKQALQDHEKPLQKSPKPALPTARPTAAFPNPVQAPSPIP